MNRKITIGATLLFLCFCALPSNAMLYVPPNVWCFDFGSSTFGVFSYHTQYSFIALDLFHIEVLCGFEMACWLVIGLCLTPALLTGFAPLLRFGFRREHFFWRDIFKHWLRAALKVYGLLIVLLVILLLLGHWRKVVLEREAGSFLSTALPLALTGQPEQEALLRPLMFTGDEPLAQDWFARFAEFREHGRFKKFQLGEGAVMISINHDSIPTTGSYTATASYEGGTFEVSIFMLRQQGRWFFKSVGLRREQGKKHHD